MNVAYYQNGKLNSANIAGSDGRFFYVDLGSYITIRVLDQKLNSIYYHDVTASTSWKNLYLNHESNYPPTIYTNNTYATRYHVWVKNSALTIIRFYYHDQHDKLQYINVLPEKGAHAYNLEVGGATDVRFYNATTFNWIQAKDGQNYVTLSDDSPYWGSVNVSGSEFQCTAYYS